MDIRTDAHDALITHIDTLRYLVKHDTPAELVWREMQGVLSESATFLELFVVPKVEPVKQYLDMLGVNPPPVIADYVPAAGATEEPATELIDGGPNTDETRTSWPRRSAGGR